MTKTDTTERLAVYLPEKLAARVRAAAKGQGRSVSNWLRRAILRALAAR